VGHPTQLAHQILQIVNGDDLRFRHERVEPTKSRSARQWVGWVRQSGTTLISLVQHAGNSTSQGQDLGKSFHLNAAVFSTRIYDEG
jgi:hypothetical protein